MIEAIVAVIVFAFLRGKTDEKWGCFFLIVVFFLIVALAGEGG